MLTDFFSSSKSRASSHSDKVPEDDQQNMVLTAGNEDPTRNADTGQATDSIGNSWTMHADHTSATATNSSDRADSIMDQGEMDLFGNHGATGSSIYLARSYPRSTMDEMSDDEMNFETEPPQNSQAMLPSTNSEPLQHNDAGQHGIGDQESQDPNYFVASQMQSGLINSDYASMGGTEGITQAIAAGADCHFHPDNSFPSNFGGVSLANNALDSQYTSQSLDNCNTDVIQVGEDLCSASNDQMQVDDRASEEMRVFPVTPELAGPETTSTGDLLNVRSSDLSNNSITSMVDRIRSSVRESDTTDALPVVSADDSVLLADQQRGRLAGYRPSEHDRLLKNRSASVPPRCVDHYSYLANWPPQEPPRCDFGRRVDVFPERDAPLHLHLQAYALRWGTWTSEIKDKEARQQILNTVADKMREAWENAIGENYYVRPMAPLDDSDHRNEVEEKGKRGRRRAVSPSKQSAGFVCETKDPFAITNGELAEHNLTMDMINSRVQEKDFGAGEKALDDILTNLGRDQLVVKDWSKFSVGMIHGRNLLVYSLFVVLDCRNECRKLGNLLVRFTKELQKKNTRARIENYREREFQHLALATELGLAQQEQDAESSVTEDGEASTMDVDAIDSPNQEDEAVSDLEEVRSNHQSSSDEEPISTAHDTIHEVSRIVLTTNSETKIYTTFSERGLDLASFDPKGGVYVGNDQSLRAAKSALCEILAMSTRLVSLKEMMKRQQNPSEMIKMNYDAKLSYEKISQAQEKLAGHLNLEFSKQSMVDREPQLQHADYGKATGTEQVTRNFLPAQNDTAQIQGQLEGISATTNPFGDLQAVVVDVSRFPSPTTSSDRNIPSSQPMTQPQRGLGHPSTQSGASTKDAASDVEASTPTHPLTPHVQSTQQGTSVGPEANSLGFTDESVAKRAYIDDVWRPWLDRQFQGRGQPPFQGVVHDWPQLRSIIEHLGFSAEQRNSLLREYRARFETWSRGKQVPQQASTPQQSPALSTVSLSSAGQSTTMNAAPPGWPSNVEILASIPPRGIHANFLLRKFQDRIGQYVNQFSQLLKQIAFMDQGYFVYPSAQHANLARQQSLGQQGSIPGSQQPLSAAPQQPSQILKLKLPQHNSANLPPAVDESGYPDDYKSTEVNETRGFSFRHLPHSTLDQRTRIDDIIGEYITTTSKGRKKNYYGQYVTFKDPQDGNTLPIAHGFWDFKDGSKAGGSDWFFNGEDIPAEWMPKLGVRDHSTNKQNVQYRDVWDGQQGRNVRLKLAGPTPAQGQGQGQGQGQDQLAPHQSYNTYPPSYNHISTAAGSHPSHRPPTHQNIPTTINPAQLMKQPAQASLRSYFDGTNDQVKDVSQTGSIESKKRGVKRGSSAVDSASKGLRGGKRRRKNVVDDDDEDEDYVPGGEF